MYLKKNDSLTTCEIELPISKSLFNRQLIIQALTNSNLNEYDNNLPDDCKVLLDALSQDFENINVGHAGTAMRFLTAYLPLQKRDVILSGSSRMHQRPISILVNALNELGAKIEHVAANDCPPLKINKSVPHGGKVSISGSVSSQYITALLLIAPSLDSGLTLTIIQPLVSRPYMDMTLNLMASFGIRFEQKENTIVIPPQKYLTNNLKMEFDWSAASFWFELVALNKGYEILLCGLQKESLQGDAIIADIFKKLGVETSFEEKGVRIIQSNQVTEPFNLDCSDVPDLALPIACTCAGLGIDCHLIGLETLFLKETNRVLALRLELEKFGISVEITKSSISFEGQKIHMPTSAIKTYNDHRMAMSFAPLVSIVGELEIENPEVVSKSYPKYWEMFAKFVEVK